MIKILNISKSFKNIEALKDITLEVNDGEILGLLGENGAGKSTLLRIISTMLKPSSGTALINGLDLISNSEEVRKNIGILFGSEVGLYDRLTPKENLEYFARLNGMSKDDINLRIEFLIEEFDFKKYFQRPCMELSKGMKQKVAIARAIVHNPSVMLFDEPESGLDFKASRTVLEFMEKCKLEGKCVIFSSHSLENIKNYSDKIAVLSKGQIMNIFSVKKYRAKYNERQINDIILNWVCKEDKND